NPLALVAGKLRVTELRLARPYVDLGEPLGKGGGLPGLFEQKPEEQRPREPEKPSSLALELYGVKLRGGRVEANYAGARFPCSEPLLLGTLELGAHSKADVRFISLDVLRDAESAARIRGRDLHYGTKAKVGGLLRIETASSRALVTGRVGDWSSLRPQPIDVH